MTLRTLCVVLLTGLVLCLPLGGATYYVAQQDPKAADANPGTAEAPYKTIRASLKGLKAGDTVVIKKGTYREYVIISPGARDGCPAVPGGKSFGRMISFEAFPGDEVVIKGSEVIAKWQLADSGPAKGKGKVYVTDGLPNPGIFSLVFCDGKRLALIGDGGGNMMEWISGWGGADAWTPKGKALDDLEEGSCFYDRATKKLYVWLPGGAEPAKHTMEATVRGDGFVVLSDYIRVSGLKVLHSSAAMCGNYGIMEDCESSDSPWNGLGIQGKYNTIIRSKFNRCGDTGICGAGRGHKFLNCETSYNNFLGMSSGWHAGAIKIISRSQGFVFDGHLSTYNTGDGIWFDTYNFDTIITNSVFHHNTGSAIFYEISERAAITNNICHENGGRGVYLSNSSDCQVMNNLFYRNGMSGVAAIGVERAGGELGEGKTKRLPARNNVIWGNLFVDNCHPDSAPKDMDGRDQPWTTRAELILPEDHVINTGNVSDYNIFFRGGGRVMPFWQGWHLKGQVWDDLKQWQAKTGQDMHSIIAQPKFRDEAKRDFRPAEGSPAREFVKPRMGNLYDREDSLRPSDDRPDGKPTRVTAGPFE